MIKITRLISLDTSSSKTGWTIFDNANYKTHGLIDFSKEKDADLRIKSMCTEIIRLFQKYNPDIIVLEKLNVGRNMVAVRALSKVIGVIYCYSIISDDISYYEMQPSEWRSKLGFQGKNRKRKEYKELAIQYIKDNFGFNVTDDEAESICVGLAYIKMFKDMEGQDENRGIKN